MIFKVNFIDFHWDNRQGNSGKTVELFCTIQINDNVEAGEIKNLLRDETFYFAKKARQIKSGIT